jgi:hypothetical protein
MISFIIICKNIYLGEYLDFLTYNNYVYIYIGKNVIIQYMYVACSDQIRINSISISLNICHFKHVCWELLNYTLVIL